MKKRNQRRKFQGVEFIVHGLRKLVKNPDTPAWIVLAAVDRLATIDAVYEVDLNALRPTKLSKPPAVEQPTVVDEEDKEGKQLLDDFNKRFFNGGQDVERNNA